MAERALADADQADARRGAGDERPLLGVPLAVKDTEDVAGEVTRRGTAAFTTRPAPDSELVRRLRAAGAVLIGKTNLPELAIIGATEGPLRDHPQPVGPRAHRRRLERRQRRRGGRRPRAPPPPPPTAPARSGIPAANCGLVGLKPQRDRIPLVARAASTGTG